VAAGASRSLVPGSGPAAVLDLLVQTLHLVQAAADAGDTVPVARTRLLSLVGLEPPATEAASVQQAKPPVATRALESRCDAVVSIDPHALTRQSHLSYLSDSSAHGGKLRSGGGVGRLRCISDTHIRRERLALLFARHIAGSFGARVVRGAGTVGEEWVESGWTVKVAENPTTSARGRATGKEREGTGLVNGGITGLGDK
jgi:hypothetical protein